MKIAHIAPPWITIPPKHYGGTEIVIYNLVEEQVAQGHDVTLLAAGDAKTSAKLVSFFPRSLIDTGVPWQAHLKAYYHIYKSVEYIKTHHFDIVHAHLSSSADMYVFPLTAHLIAPRVVTTLHSHFPFDRVQSWLGDADDYYLEWISSVPMVAISESAMSDVGYPLTFVGVVHHGLPMQAFRPTTKQPENFLVWLGRMVPEKGAHIAIQVARETGLPLVLAGTVDAHIPVSVNYFEDIIKPEIDNQQIRYIGPVDMEQKKDLLSRARVFLNPIGWEEPFGMVMIEAMAMGCPVITFARGAAPEIVAHQKSGFIAKNVREMVQYVAKVNELDREVVRAHVERNFSVKVMAEKYTKIYKQVIASAAMKSSFPKIPVIAPLPLVAPKSKLVKHADTLQSEYSSALIATSSTEIEPLS